jgi:Mg-chelatase subunit ChlD
MKEIHYRVSAPVLGGFPGSHRSPRGDSGFEMRGHAALLDAPDARRLDLHASLRDPFGDWRVRVYSQRRSVPVVVLADLSASMGFAGRHRKAEVMADFVGSLAWSAWRTGDSFGFVGCDAAVREDWLQWPTRSRAAGQVMAQALRGWTPAGASASSAVGLLEAGPYLGRQRALVFLLSDFHLPLDLLRKVLDRLAAHQVVPVVLWDEQEFSLGERNGLAEVLDAESGRRRLIWWRPQLRERRQRAQADRRAALLQVFARERLQPLFFEQGFDADAVTRHFHAA